MRISGVVEESITDGKGVRTTVFFQGCPHHCEGCHNPGTWDYAGGYDIEPQAIIESVQNNPIIKGVTFSGGEPMSERNYKPMLEIIEALKKIGKDIWVYTGYTLEQLEGKKDPIIDKILNNIDVLVDGVFIQKQKNLELHFKGSSNQRVIDIQKYKAKGIIKEIK